MADDATSVELQGLIDRLGRGDETARRALLDRACQRLRKLAARMLHGSFPAVQARHELDSVVHETWLRLLQALETTQPTSVAHFFHLAALKIRQVLLDMADRQRRHDQREALASGSALEAGAVTHDPAQLAMWTEVHRRVESLPEQQRAVFDMHYYLELPQAEIARLLELRPRAVSRLWIAATDQLAEGLTDAEGML